MKNIVLVFLALFIVTESLSQSTFNTNFENSENNTVELSIHAREIIIIGHNSNEIVIETEGVENSSLPKPPQEPSPEIPERAKGLKSVSGSSKDNTGLGLRVEKTDGFLRIISMPNAKAKKILVTLPKNVKLIFADMIPQSNGKSNYKISGFSNEITVSSLNSNFEVNKISGPLVLNTTNGNAEVVFEELNTTKPISIVTVNGFVDLTMPSATKADLSFHTINGQIYSDFDIKKEDDADMHLTNMNMVHIEGKISGGGVPINVNTVNGDIYFRKK